MVTVQIHIDEPFRKLLEQEAARQNVNVEAYLLMALREKLASDVQNNADTQTAETSVDVNSLKVVDKDLLDQMKSSRESMLQRRNGVPIRVDVVNLVRTEREDEIIASLLY